MNMDAGDDLTAHGPAAPAGRGPFGGIKQPGIGRSPGCEGGIQFQDDHSISDPERPLTH